MDVMFKDVECFAGKKLATYRTLSSPPDFKTAIFLKNHSCEDDIIYNYSYPKVLEVKMLN